MPVFQDDSGVAVKFFIQKDLPEGVQAELCETITSLGGRVEGKVPRQGYILVQPGSPEEQRLRLCWTSPDRPDRHFVPYTYVEACKVAGSLLKQIFVEDSEPIPMHIHPSIANVNVRNALAQRIIHSGGDPHASEQTAKVILADPNTDVFNHLIKTCQGQNNKYIESYLWVKKCIEKGIVIYTPLVYKNPGGRRPGEERMQFTEEDEERLCEWIAAKIPYKETGGRTGNRLYQQLCEMANEPEYAWVTRHTWQSWRERYKKNAARLDRIIACIVEQKKPAQGEKGQYGYVRQAEGKVKRPKKKRTENGVPDGPSDYSIIEGIANIPPMALASLQVPMHIHGPGPSQFPPPMPGGIGVYGQAQALNGNPLTSGGAKRNSMIGQLLEEDEEDREWRIRVGNAEPPPWSKRKAGDDQGDQGTKKRRKISPNSTPQGPAVQQNELSHQDLVAIANLHVIDQDILAIAKDCRFTVDEVHDYYNRCGDMTKTKLRFEQMRQLLQEKFSEND